MEGMFTFVGIIIIVFGILQIILFFKMWIMTDNVKKIKDAIQISGYPSGVSPAKVEFILGNTEKAKEMATKEFIIDIYKIYAEVCNHVYTEPEYIEKFNDLEKEYKTKFDNTSSFIDFEKFSTYDKAQKVFC